MNDQTRINRHDLFVDGRFQPAESTARIDVINPATEEVTGSVADASAADVERAIAAARRAQHGWGRSEAAERGAILTAIADGIDRRADEMKDLLRRQNAAPKWWRDQDVGLAAMIYRQAGAAASRLQAERLVEGPNGLKTLLRDEPIGVVGAITPWNSPQALQAMKVANAFAAGCAVVVKPSPETTLDTFILAEIMSEAGVPAGVMNIVPGGANAGQAVVASRGIDKVSFTGSTAAGQSVAMQCAQNFTPVVAELGGKSAAVLLDDADIDSFVASIQRECLPFSAQACFSTTRIIVPRHLHDEVVAAARAFLEALPFGDPADDATIMGPLVSARQRDRVEGYLHSGVSEGAKLVMGGGRARGFDRGFYIAPTIFTDVTPDMAIFREEIFGPVLTFTAYDSEDEARRLHDATDYGLNGSVFSRDTGRATEFARHLETGQILINGRRGNPAAVRDMYKRSAYGGGVDRIAGFQQTKGISQP